MGTVTIVPPGGRERRGQGRPHPKGRRVDPEVLARVRAILGDRPRTPDLLIEHLHRLQDRFGHLSAAHLAALAEEMRLAQAEVFEVATFYAHFDVLREGEDPPPPLTLRVCDSIACALEGSERLRAELAATLDPRTVRVLRAPCMGACDRAPAGMLGHRLLAPLTRERAHRAVAECASEAEIPAAQDLPAYRAEGGFRQLSALRTAREREAAVARVLDELDRAGLRGLGGAGFPTARKWRIVRSFPGPRELCVNADEGEPGTFKDGWHLARHPYRFLEGVLIAGEVVEAERMWIYLRDEYPHVRLLLERAIRELESEGLVAPGRLLLRRGAGAYICGEESALIESIEGKRGLPRHRPPYVAERGLFGRPTLVNNVETLCWVPVILEKGGEWFAAQGRRGAKGLRSFSVSGRIREPGVKIAPAGITLRELVDEYCGGMAPGHELFAYLPGGASGGILPARLADLPLDFGTLEPYGCFIGSHAVVVLSHRDDLRAVARNLMAFFADESCGQCTPCRVGTEKALALMRRPRWDGALLRELAQAMRDASICGLGQAAPNPLESLFRHFPELFAAEELPRRAEA
ncbi:MAG: NAD(P)H-dependent oxidoreductase subunit E [Geminicoccaceae bacterium]|nr:NAD(P)H-dependent oxidoreductase subunit E [Geminicoccaceae bacterium]